MTSENNPSIIAFLSLIILAAVLACAAEKAALPVKNGIPQDELAYYSDTFDKIREDLWDRAGYLYREEQRENFKQADMRFVKGKLIIRTQTGSFSKGGIASRYVLRGDFDIQLDCQMDLLKGITGMDQLFNIAVLDTSKRIGNHNTVGISLSMKGGSDHGSLISTCSINGKRQGRSSIKIENFNGTFRILRAGKNISTLYRQNRASEWHLMNNFDATDNDMIFGVQLRNFFTKRATIQAEQSIFVELESFKINAAQEIIEEEI